MPRFTLKTDGEDIVVETSVPREAAELRAQGFTEHKAKTAAVRATDEAAAPAPADAAPAKPAK